MPGDEVGAVLAGIWLLATTYPGLAFVIFLLIFLGLVLLFSKIGAATPWTLMMVLVIAIAGTSFILLELSKRGIIGLIVVLAGTVVLSSG
jgi:uncharacterized protein (DUF983 family)